MKRTLSIFLTLCMLLGVLALPALAYDKAGTDLWPSEWHAALNIAFADATADPLTKLAYTQEVGASADADAIKADVASQCVSGMITLSNNATLWQRDAYVRNLLLTKGIDATDHLLVTENGSTLDLGMKITALPNLSDDYIKVDASGNFVENTALLGKDVANIGRYTGIVVRVLSMGDYRENGAVKVDGSGNAYNTEYYLSFVGYENEKLGTNGAIIFSSGDVGNNQSWREWNRVKREVFFVNLDTGRFAKYHRYTVSVDFDAASGTDKVTLYIDGEKATTFSAPGYSANTATSLDTVSIGLNHIGQSDAFKELTTEDPAALADKISALEGELAALKAQLTEAQDPAKVAEREARLAELEVEIATLNDDIAYYEEVLADPNASNRDKNLARRELPIAQEDLAAATAEKAALEGLVDSLTKQISDKQTTLDNDKAREAGVKAAREQEITKNRSSIRIALDQLSIYSECLTPKDGTMSTFKETAPLYTDDYEKALADAKAVEKDRYSKKSYAAVDEALKEAAKLPAVEDMTLKNVTQAQLDALVQKIRSAIAGLKLNDFNSEYISKTLMIPFSFYNANDTATGINATGYKYAWTNATILFSDPNYDIAEYKYGTNAADLASFTSVVFAPTANAGEYVVKAVYSAGTEMAKREINKAPVGGFIIYNHKNIPGTSTSRYASQLFGDKNADIISQIKVGDIAVLNNVTLNDGTAATLTTSGVWRCRYDASAPAITPTSTGATCNAVLAQYPNASPKWQDQFDDFETLSNLELRLPIGAYLDDYNRAVGRANAINSDDYTEDSVKKLEEAMAKADLTRDDLTQDMIDEWTDAITAAYNALVSINAGGEGEGDANNQGNGEDTSDVPTVFITLTVMALLAVGCVVALVIGRRRGNF